jgi:hypothetical protein
MTITNLIISVGVVVAAFSLMKSDVRGSTSMLRRNMKQLRVWWGRVPLSFYNLHADATLSRGTMPHSLVPPYTRGSIPLTPSQGAGRHLCISYARGSVPLTAFTIMRCDSTGWAEEAATEAGAYTRPHFSST